MSMEISAQTQGKERTVIKALGFLGVSGGVPCAVDTKDGKILRIRPLHVDWKYDRDKIKLWKIQVRGKVLEPQMKMLPGAFSLAYKKRVYSPNRIKYPLKRVDWDPNGERNTQNRGKSKYKRISWDEASELIANEIKRVHKQYGPLAIMVQGDGHGECKTVHSAHGNSALLLDKLGGFTQQVRNPDSWEGWYYGAKFVWGEGYVGLARPADNLTKDISENCELALCWGCDPEVTPMGFTGQSATSISYFWTDLGIKQIYICPDLNYGAAIHADKWIPVLPNTDAALQLAIIYTWLTEDTYDKEYVATHTVGMDKVADYVLGKEDGIPKTPAWASPKCGVPEWTIKALARQFAAKRTSIIHFAGGSLIRGPYSHEPARLEGVLLGMRGMGKPGIHQCQISSYPGMPRFCLPKGTVNIRQTTGARLVKPAGVVAAFAPVRVGMFSASALTGTIFGKQYIPKTLIEEAILHPPIKFWGTGAIGAEVDDQLVKYEYPISKEKGGTEIHMIWTDNPCRTTCWNDGMHVTEALRHPSIECIVVQHPWFENDLVFADLILPSNTTMEVEDIVPCNGIGSSHIDTVCLQGQAIPPVGESKSDFEVVLEVAKKFGMEKEVAEGRTFKESIKYYFENRLKLSEDISWEEFQEKEYFIMPLDKDWEKEPAGFFNFYKDPQANPLQTPSGKLEFYSERLANRFPDDQERPPIPKWIENSETHHERISSERAQLFPLLMVSNHGRWRVHAQCDDISWTREAPTCKVKGWDGYMYEPLWMNTQDAAKRGIKNGDIVKIFNERGTVLAGAYVNERMMPGALSMDHGAICDFIIPGRLDRGGAINLISPRGTVSKNCNGQATSGYLVEVAKVTLEEMEGWRRMYPEAFVREYDPASGLRFNAWVE